VGTESNEQVSLGIGQAPTPLPEIILNVLSRGDGNNVTTGHPLYGQVNK
jgi:hypothetical protein